MKKVFILSLFLISIFLIGNAEVALAQGEGCQDYECTGVVTCEGEYNGTYEECVTLCTDGFYGDIDSYWFGCSLLSLDGKHYLGEGGSMGGDIGCSVSFSGRSMTLIISGTEDECIGRNICVPCDECCEH